MTILTWLNEFDIEYLLDMTVIRGDLEDCFRYILDTRDVDRDHIV